MDDNKGYTFLLSVARDNQADEEERIEAVRVLVDVDGLHTLDVLVELYQTAAPVTINFKRVLLHAIGELIKKRAKEHGRKHED